jgi:DNA-binding FadR family transcriptional regulator
VALTGEAIEQIKQMIIPRRLRPGDKLDVRRGDGTSTTSLAPSLLLEALSFMVGFHRNDTVLEFMEVRRILGPAATALAAVRMPVPDLPGLEQVLRSVRGLAVG